MTPIGHAEPLERRALLSVVLENGLLSVFGTEADDTIKVENRTGLAIIVTLNGQAQTFDLASVTAVKVRGFQGNDTITVGSITPASESTGRKVDVAGGAGNDTINTT